MAAYKDGLTLILLAAVFLMNTEQAGCNVITNTDLNANIREHSVTENEIINSSNVRTLQKEPAGRYASFAPVRNPIRFKEIPDNAYSSSSHSRGLQLYHGHAYAGHDYEEPHHGYGYDFHAHDLDHDYGHDHGHDHSHYDHHDSDHHGHHGGHHGHHHLGYAHHHKYHDHALAAKTILWPIAGIALLGAAAALVTNPVLLQLGVVSGRRKRRDTEEITGPDFNFSWLKPKHAKTYRADPDPAEHRSKNIKRKLLNMQLENGQLSASENTQLSSEIVKVQGGSTGARAGARLIPIQLQFKDNVS